MSVSSYQARLRTAVRGLFKGTLTRSQFTDALESAIRRGLTQAWIEGAKQCGVGQDELTEKETDALAVVIKSEFEHIGNLADYIKEAEKLAMAFGRLTLWVNRYTDIQNQAKVMACADKKLEWALGTTEDHCRTCPKLNGKVKRGSQWEKLGIRPQSPPNPCLECGGWRCLCQLRVTDKAISRGSLGVSC